MAGKSKSEKLDSLDAFLSAIDSKKVDLEDDFLCTQAAPIAPRAGHQSHAAPQSSFTSAKAAASSKYDDDDDEDDDGERLPGGLRKLEAPPPGYVPAFKTADNKMVKITPQMYQKAHQLVDDAEMQDVSKKRKGPSSSHGFKPPAPNAFAGRPGAPKAKGFKKPRMMPPKTPASTSSVMARPPVTAPGRHGFAKAKAFKKPRLLPPKTPTPAATSSASARPPATAPAKSSFGAKNSNPRFDSFDFVDFDAIGDVSAAAGLGDNTAAATSSTSTSSSSLSALSSTSSSSSKNSKSKFDSMFDDVDFSELPLDEQLPSTSGSGASSSTSTSSTTAQFATPRKRLPASASSNASSSSARHSSTSTPQFSYTPLQNKSSHTPASSSSRATRPPSSSTGNVFRRPSFGATSSTNTPSSARGGHLPSQARRTSIGAGAGGQMSITPGFRHPNQMRKRPLPNSAPSQTAALNSQHKRVKYGSGGSGGGTVTPKQAYRQPQPQFSPIQQPNFNTPRGRGRPYPGGLGRGGGLPSQYSSASASSTGGGVRGLPQKPAIRGRAHLMPPRPGKYVKNRLTYPQRTPLGSGVKPTPGGVNRPWTPQPAASAASMVAASPSRMTPQQQQQATAQRSNSALPKSSVSTSNTASRKPPAASPKEINANHRGDKENASRDANTPGGRGATTAPATAPGTSSAPTRRKSYFDDDDRTDSGSDLFANVDVDALVAQTVAGDSA